MPDLVQDGDEEVIEDEKHDAFADYFKSSVQPKILITSSVNRKSNGKVWKLFHQFKWLHELSLIILGN